MQKIREICNQLQPGTILICHFDGYSKIFDNGAVLAGEVLGIPVEDNNGVKEITLPKEKQIGNSNPFYGSISKLMKEGYCVGEFIPRN